MSSLAAKIPANWKWMVCLFLNVRNMIVLWSVSYHCIFHQISLKVGGDPSGEQLSFGVSILKKTPCISKLTTLYTKLQPRAFCSSINVQGGQSMHFSGRFSRGLPKGEKQLAWSWSSESPPNWSTRWVAWKKRQQALWASGLKSFAIGGLTSKSEDFAHRARIQMQSQNLRKVDTCTQRGNMI